MGKNKSLVLVISILLIVSVLTVCMLGCEKSYTYDPEYFNKVGEYAFWDNDKTESISQINVSKRVRDYLNTPSENGKEKKVLFIGYDGCRADMMQHVLDTKTGEKKDAKSAILETIKYDGAGIYMSYAGGEFRKKESQSTCTGPGWASILTGVWYNKHKVWDNMDVKKPDYKSFVLDSAIGTFNNGKVYNSAFISSTNMHFATQYLDELNYLRDNPKDGATMPEKKEHDYFIKEKRKWSESLYPDKTHEYVDAIVPNTKVPAKYVYIDDTIPEGVTPGGYYGDVLLRDEMLKAINDGTDVIFGIFDGTDHTGHKIGFSKGNDPVPEYLDAFRFQEALAADLVKAVDERMKTENEDWLIVMTTDHGGINTSHGQQSLEERTTWVACNKGFDSCYFAKDYNGFNSKKK